MATASLNIRLNYRQILELARQLSDEDKLQLNRELAAEVRKIKLQFWKLPIETKISFHFSKFRFEFSRWRNQF